MLDVVVVEAEPPFLPAATLWVDQLTIQLSVVGVSGAGEKDMRCVGGRGAGGCCSSL